MREKEQRRSQGDSELPQPGREEQDDEEEDQWKVNVRGGGEEETLQTDRDSGKCSSLGVPKTFIQFRVKEIENLLIFKDTVSYNSQI